MRHEVRPLLSPMVVVKYLACRDTPAKRKRLRQVRKQIQQASPYAQRQMTDANGALNPGLIPQSLDDLRQIAPDRTEMDDQLVDRWNRLGEVWRGNPEFREAVLRYATRSAASHPASAELWPEVVYPLDRAGALAAPAPVAGRGAPGRPVRPRAPRPQPRPAVRSLLPHGGPRAGRRQARHLARGPGRQPRARDRPRGPGAGRRVTDPTSTTRPRIGPEHPGGHQPARPGDRLHPRADRRPGKARRLVRLAGPDPVRFLQGELRDLWQEAVAALQAPGPKKGHRHVPVGPYRLTVVPSVRGRSAGQLAIQGMPNKQIEILTPPFRTRNHAGKPILAAWAYRDNSLALVHLDFRGVERYILWHAPSGRQTNYDTAAELNHDLYQLGLEAPDQLDRVLSKPFRPRNAV